MEADHRRAQVEKHGEHLRVIGEAAVDDPQVFGRFGVELGKDGAQAVEPVCLACGVGRRGGMHEEIDVEGLVGAGPQILDHLASRGGVAGAEAERSQRACVADRGGKCGRGDARHRGLDDRVGEVQAVGHGGSCLGRCHGETRSPRAWQGPGRCAGRRGTAGWGSRRERHDEPGDGGMPLRGGADRGRGATGQGGAVPLS